MYGQTPMRHLTVDRDRLLRIVTETLEALEPSMTATAAAEPLDLRLEPTTEGTAADALAAVLQDSRE
jgi:hypothetical protein